MLLGPWDFPVKNTRLFLLGIFLTQGLNLQVELPSPASPALAGGFFTTAPLAGGGAGVPYAATNQIMALPSIPEEFLMCSPSPSSVESHRPDFHHYRLALFLNLES